MRGAASAATTTIAQEVDDTLSLLDYLRVDQTFSLDNQDAFRHVAGLLIKGQRLASAIVMADPFGKVLMHTLVSDQRALPFNRSLSLYEDLRNNPRPLVSEPFVGLVQDERILAVAMPLLANGQLAGSLSATIPVWKLSALLRAQDLPEGWVIAVTDRRGAVIARSDDAAAANQRIDAAAGGEDDIRIGDFPGIGQGVAASKILSMPEWRIYCMAPAAGLDPILRNSYLIAFAWMLAALAASLGLALPPMRRLVIEARALAAFAGSPDRSATARHELFAVDELATARSALLDSERLLRELAEQQRGTEQQLRKAWSEAESARREAARAGRTKTAFLAAASHDLRQPAQSMLLFVELLKMKLRGHPAAPIVESLQQTADSLNVLLSGILDISKIDASFVRTDLTSVELASILQDIKTEFEEQAAARGLSLRVLDCDVTIRTDVLLMTRILRHLVENALKFTDKGGVLVGCRRRGQLIRIDVVDTGHGIAEEHLESIFEEFFQIENPNRDRKRGTGLGLAIVRRLAVALEHPIEVSSRPGRGSRFSVGVMEVAPQSPAARKQGIEFSPGPLPDPAGPLNPLLVIVDELYVRTAMCTVLVEWGFEVVEAASHQEAVRSLGGRRPTLVIVDQRLSDGESGNAAISAVRAQYGLDLPAVIISADLSPSAMAAAREVGATLLGKPVSLHELRKVIRRELQRS
ncbi:ATP-binding protein [Azospirillum picis]|uniref:histidine kinase n=1 Tax=Azospirillum picis TaxID=488438 RepID=A0ABU0MMC9_9PROT|nr:ATP-binding protein [Azospirillum picis]MBP2300653.1 signal transduction histidine kinase [Azospirillum picis]MDQ0534622.1 signal transduction histidine kinase [Azospirillum picis]